MKKKDTKEAREFWELAEKTSKEVDAWPEWKKSSFLKKEEDSDKAREKPIVVEFF